MTQYDYFTSFYGFSNSSYILGLGVEFASTIHCDLNALDPTNITTSSSPWAYDDTVNDELYTCGYNQQVT